MRLHNTESLMPSACRGLTNIHLNPNNSGNSQTNNNKNVGTSIAISCADGTSSSNIGNSSSSSSLSTSALMNGHAIPIGDKSMVSPKNRHIADVRTFASRLAVKDESSASSNSSENRAYTRGNYCNPVAEQSAIIKLDSRNVPRCEQSSSIISGQQICADACGLSRQDQSALPNMDSSGPSQVDLSVSPHADVHSGNVLRIEQPIVATLPDSRTVRLEQSMNILFTDICGTRQPDHTNIRRLSVTNEDLCPTTRQEQSTTNILVSEDLRGMRQHADQPASSVRVTEDSRISRAEQPINTQGTLDLARGMPRSQQNTNISLNDGRALISRPEQSTMIPLTEGRSNSIAEHVSPAVMPDLRSGVPRILQTAASLPSQAVAVPVAGQSVAQSGSSVLITEEVGHSEEPLPPGWEMRYDLYGRR